MDVEKNYNARNVALSVLCRVLEDKEPSHTVIAGELDKYPQMTKEDRAFVKQLCMGTIEWVITLDDIINRYSKTKTEKQKPVIRNLLRLSAYQILFLNVPDSAACNEAVKLARKRKFEGLTGFVNGVLRKISAEKSEIMKTYFKEVPDTGSTEQDDNDPSVRYSLPEWIIKYYTDTFGPEKAISAFEYFLKEAGLNIRCNISRITPGELAGRLKKRGINVIPDPYSNKCMKISGIDRLSELPEFNQGMFCVQDLSSVLAGENPANELLKSYTADKVSILNNYTDKSLSRSETDKSKNNYILNILDLCAAPGGKTLNLADRLKAEGFEAHFTACDISESKLKKIRENIKRCGFDNIDSMINDATCFRDEFVEKFDILIADLPCSGLGVIGRKPDIKLNASLEKIDELAALQKTILENAVRYVKKGGFLLFSTCTIGHVENEDNLRFIEEHGFKRINSVQLCPGEYDCDGFYYSLSVRE